MKEGGRDVAHSIVTDTFVFKELMTHGGKDKYAGEKLKENENRIDLKQLLRKHLK